MTHERNRTERHASIPRSVRGYSLEGPGFFVWDEDAREVQLAGQELLRTVESCQGRRRERGGAEVSPPTTPESPER